MRAFPRKALVNVFSETRACKSSRVLHWPISQHVELRNEAQLFFLAYLRFCFSFLYALEALTRSICQEAQVISKLGFGMFWPFGCLQTLPLALRPLQHLQCYWPSWLPSIWYASSLFRASETSRCDLTLTIWKLSGWASIRRHQTRIACNAGSRTLETKP